eukprot:1403192-Pyramimonas_sp.AAC.2
MKQNTVIIHRATSSPYGVFVVNSTVSVSSPPLHARLTVSTHDASAQADAGKRQCSSPRRQRYASECTLIVLKRVNIRVLKGSGTQASVTSQRRRRTRPRLHPADSRQDCCGSGRRLLASLQGSRSCWAGEGVKCGFTQQRGVYVMSETLIIIVTNHNNGPTQGV